MKRNPGKQAMNPGGDAGLAGRGGPVLDSRERIVPPANLPVRIALLLASHVLAEFFAILWIFQRKVGDHWEYPTFTLLGLVFGQTCLVVIWGCLGRSPWYIRFLGVLAGVGLLGLIATALGEIGGDIMICVVLSAVSVAAVLLAFRLNGFRIGWPASRRETAARMQFSIRHLMLLTVVVACLLALAKSVKLREIGGDEAFFLSFLARVTVLLVLPGLTSVWPLLGTRNPLVGLGIFAASAVGTVCVGQVLFLKESRYLVHPLAMLLLVGPPLFVEALVLAVSLLAVRQWGVRLVRLPPQTASHHGRKGGSSVPPLRRSSARLPQVGPWSGGHP